MRLLTGLLALSLGACAQTPAERAALNNAIQNFNWSPTVAPPKQRFNCTSSTSFGTTTTDCQQQ